MRMLFVVMWMSLLATPAMASEDVSTIARLGLGTDSLAGGFWTYSRLDFVEQHGVLGNQRPWVNPLVGGVGLETVSNWKDRFSFGLSAVGGMRTAYFSLGGALVWRQELKSPLDLGGSLGVHAPIFSVAYLSTVRGERLMTVAVVLDAKFWIHLARNREQFKEQTPSPEG